MKIVRIVTALIFGFLGSIALLMGFDNISGGVIEHTIQNSREIEITFNNASIFIASFRDKHGRLPTEQEFENWATAFPGKSFSSPKGMTLLTSSFPDEAINKFGVAPDGSFLLVFWRGEWYEYYASWAQRTSLQFDESKYYLSGSKYTDSILFICIAIIVFIGCIKIWPNKKINLTAGSCFR